MLKLIKWIIYLLIIIGLTLSAIYFFASKTPSWVSANHQSNLSQRVTQSMSGDSLKELLSSNLSMLLSTGELELDNKELTILTYGALLINQDGQRLVENSKDIQAKIDSVDQEIEIGTIINTNNLQKLTKSTSAASKIEMLFDKFSWLKDKDLFISLKGKPFVKNGNIGIDQNARFYIGSVPISTNFLNSLGVDTTALNSLELDVKYAQVQAVRIEQDKVKLSIKPKF